MKVVEAYRQRTGDDLEVVVRLHPETKEDFKTINSLTLSSGLNVNKFIEAFVHDVEVEAIDTTPKRIIDV